MPDWQLTERDQDLFARDLQSFVPPVVFDAHAHWYHLAHFAEGTVTPFLQNGPASAGREAYQAAMQQLTPGRTTTGLFFPYPRSQLKIEQANEFLAKELLACPGSRGQMLVTPADDPEWIREQVQQHGFVGLKCYHIYAPAQPTFDARIEEFLPEEQVRIAHEEGLTITLHMVKARALAEPDNQETIRRYCTRYPQMQLILAHAARGFNPHHTIEGIDALADLPNIWFDTSVVTDAGALEIILQRHGSERLLYGSDFPVSQMRGRCVALGDTFFWISAENTQLNVPYANLELALIGHEALRTLKVACLSTKQSDKQVEDIFWRNAQRLWNLKSVVDVTC